MLVALCSRKSNLNNSFLQADVLISSFSAHNPAVITLSHVLVLQETFCVFCNDSVSLHIPSF